MRVAGRIERRIVPLGVGLVIGRFDELLELGDRHRIDAHEERPRDPHFVNRILVSVIEPPRFILRERLLHLLQRFMTPHHELARGNLNEFQSD